MRGKNAILAACMRASAMSWLTTLVDRRAHGGRLICHRMLESKTVFIIKNKSRIDQGVMAGLFAGPGAFSLDSQRIYVPIGDGFKVYSILPNLQMIAAVSTGMSVKALAVMQIKGEECLVVAADAKILQLWKETKGRWSQIGKNTVLPFEICTLLGDPAGAILYGLCRYTSVPKKGQGVPMSKIYRMSFENLGKVTLVAKISGNAKLALAKDGRLIYTAKRAIFCASGEESIPAIIRSHPIGAVAVNPADPSMLAVSDARGRIFLLKDAFTAADSVHERILHWHSGPVASLAFSPDGSYLFSGGSERVLVSWHVSSGERQFLPRLTAPISHVSVSPGGEYYQALCGGSNSIYLISPANMTVVGQINGIAPVIPLAPIMVPSDGQSALWLSSAATPGHLQLWDPFEDVSLGDFDCCRQNIISAGNQKISHFAVKKLIQLTEKTMVTFEERLDEENDFHEGIIRVWRGTDLAAVALVGNVRITDISVYCKDGSLESIYAASNCGSILKWTMLASSKNTLVLPLMAKIDAVGGNALPIRSIQVSPTTGHVLVTAGSTIYRWNGSLTKLEARLCAAGKAPIIETRILDSDHLVARDAEYVAVWNFARGKLLWSVILRTLHLMLLGEGTFAVLAEEPVILGFGVASSYPTLVKTFKEQSDIIGAAVLNRSVCCLLTKDHRIVRVPLSSAELPATRKTPKVPSSLLSKRLLEEGPTMAVSKAPRLPVKPKTQNLVLPNSIPSHLLPSVRVLFWSPFMESILTARE